MAQPRFTLAWADYVIFGVIICISIGIGIFHALSGSRQRTTSEYLVGDRKMSYLPVSLSYTATFMSSIFFLGTPAEMYAHGVQYILAFYATVIANLLAAFFTVPLFHHLRITSGYEYLELRFNSMAVRKMGSCFGILTNVLYMGVVLFGPAVALKAVAGFPLWTSVLVIGASSIAYTAIGGIKAVVWTDVFQSLIMVSGLVAIVIKSMFDIGGAERFWELNSEGGRLHFSFDLDPTVARTFWTCLFGGIVKWFTFSFNQSSILRYVSIPSLSGARKMMFWSTPTFLILSTTAALEGLCAYAFYSNKRCDPFKEGVITNSNQILPYFIMELFHTTPGLPGLFLASLFSASLSTLSSCLSSVSACTLTDFVRPCFPRMSELRATVVAQLIVPGEETSDEAKPKEAYAPLTNSKVVIFGCVAIGLSFLIMQISGTVTQIAFSLLGAVDGPTCSIFVLGALVPCANKYGALTGGLVGIGVTLWVSLGASFNGYTTPWLASAPTDGCVANTSGTDTFPFSSPTPTSFDTTPMYSYLQDTVETHKSALDIWYSISFLHHTFLGMLVTFTVGIIVSFLTGRTRPRTVNPAYISYLVRGLYYSKKRLADLDEELRNLQEVNLDLYVRSGAVPQTAQEDYELTDPKNETLLVQKGDKWRIS